MAAGLFNCVLLVFIKLSATGVEIKLLRLFFTNLVHLLAPAVREPIPITTCTQLFVTHIITGLPQPEFLLHNI